MKNSNKIIINTAVSYAALLLKLIVGLFTERYVLQALGEDDYGVYVIVGGIVAMLDVLNSNMSNTSMRYLAYSLGSKDKEEIYVTFNTTVFIHYLIGFATIIVLEVGGYFMFEYIVNIPLERINDAKIIYQFMILSTFISVISVPYDAVTNAHEKIWMLSVFDVISVGLIFSLALFLLVFEGDRLIMYGLCLMLIQLIMRFVKVIYAKRHFDECRKVKIKFVKRHRIKEILSFTGWNLFGSVAALGVTQIRSLILNMFFGVKLNAAEGITRKLTSPLNMIVTSMTRAINPQIMKSEGGDNHERMKYLVSIGSKYSTFLFALFGIPVLIEMPYILNIWLDKVPDFAIIFCQLSIIAMLVEKFTFQLVHAISAVGRIRNFQIVGAITSLLYLPIAWFLFKIGCSPVTIYFLSIVSNVLMAFVRLYYGYKVADIKPSFFIRTAILPLLLPLVISSVLSLGIYRKIEFGIVNFVSVFVSFSISFLIFFWFIGMDKSEHQRWIGLYGQIKKTFFLKKL